MVSCRLNTFMKSIFAFFLLLGLLLWEKPAHANVPGGGTNGPARITANVFLNNWVSGSRIGVGVSQRTSNTLFQRTALYDVAVPFVDRGRSTQNIDTSLRTDDAYTPERGPIR